LILILRYDAKMITMNESILASQNKEMGEPKQEEETHEDYSDKKHKSYDEPGFVPTKTEPSEKPARPNINDGSEKRQITENDLFRSLSRRRTTRSDKASRAPTQEPENLAEQEEINKLLSRMFGKTRQESSEDEKTRHVGVVWKNLTVKGMGLGAALQPSAGDIFFALPRFVRSLFRYGPKSATRKPPIRTIINNFSGCLKPGEMLLVLGRPGAGCSTFLKVFGNQRFGYEAIEGDVTYGGTDAKTMAKKYGGEILYNPEDDLHYGTLKVKETLKFALKTRTPGKSSRKEGESRQDYVKEFLRVVSKLLWLEHTLETKVGNELIHGVSGGERKRVSIAEAMITRASTQSWDNSTRGLDANTALEYVLSLRSLTNMANICTAVALYQAGESLYDKFDKVLLIEDGECCYFGPSDDAAVYFKKLGFEQPNRWTTADFLTSVTDPHERHVRDGWQNRIPKTSEEFADIYRKSEVYQRNQREIEELQKEMEQQAEERAAAEGKNSKHKNYTIPFYKQVLACTRRQFLVMIGDRQSLVGKWGGILFQAVIVGSLFYNLPKTGLGVFPRGGKF
jgi:ATP-binding cassette, subfamily G (WHITE), member 2, PDR